MNILNFDRICRVCKSESDNLELIFKDFQTPETPSNFAEMLMACASVQVLSGDGLPKSLCVHCIEKLQNAYKFRKQCEATDVSLRNYLKENGIKQELMYNPDITENVIDFTTILSVKNSIKSEITQNLQNEDIIIACNNMHMKEIQSTNNLPLNKTNSSKCKSNYKCHVCNKEYSCSSHLQRHLRLHYPRKIYICKICNKSLSRLEHLKRHMVIHLKNKPHVCKTCKRGFNKEDNLYTHEQRCKGQRPYICKICNRGFNREDSLEVHVASHDSNVDIKPMLDSLENIENYIRVENYADTLIEKNYLEPHVSIFEQDSDFEKDDGFENKEPIVPTCEPKEDSTVKETDIKTEIELEEKYDLSDSLRLPSDTDSKDENEVNSDVPQKRKRGRPRKGEIRTPPIKKKKNKKRQNQVQIVPLKKEKANFKNFSCNQCERLFLTPLDLEIHQLKHAGVQKFSCKVCLKEFIRGDHLKRHMICHLEHKPYSCDICTKSFARKDHMIRHVKLHSFEKKYECDVCKRMFSREELLNKHKAVKHGIGEKIIPEKKFKCETCGKFFTTEKYRDTHMKAHKEKDKMVHCKTCDRHFETRAELVNHLKLTNDCSRRFLCSECGQRFTKKDYLQVHMRRHRGEKPFKCKYCEKGFPRTTDLKAHEKCHTGEKNHLCIVCGKGFGRAYKLTLHMRTHTGEKPYQCTYCDAAFAQSNDLKAHIRRHTGERYHCDLCTDAFLMGYMLTQHKRNVHGIEVASSQRPIARLQPSVYNISVVKPETLRAPTTTTTLDPRPIPAFSFSQTLNLLNHPNYT